MLNKNSDIKIATKLYQWFGLMHASSCQDIQSSNLYYALLSFIHFLIVRQFEFGLLHMHQFQFILHIPSIILFLSYFHIPSFLLTSCIPAFLLYFLHPDPSLPILSLCFFYINPNNSFIRLIIDKEVISSIPYHYSIIQQLTSSMSKFLKGNREELKSKIYNKLNLTNTDDSDGYVDRESLRQENSQEHLDKMMKETEKRKLSIRKMINSSNTHADFSDEMAQLKWRIDALKNFSRNQKEKMLMAHKSTSLTGKQEEGLQRELSFDEMYELQKRKFALLRQRRKTKINDPKYVDMIGNMQLRKEKRKTQSKVKVEDQMRILNEKIQEKIE